MLVTDRTEWRIQREVVTASKDLRMLLRSALELVKHEGYITMWRTCDADNYTAHHYLFSSFPLLLCP